MLRLLLLLTLALASAPTLFAQGVAQWEQRVAYQMEVDVDAPNHQMTGTQRLTYTNNSPYALDRVYWHLYFNAFNPQSMMAERNRNLPDADGRVVPRIFELTDEEVGYHNVHSITMDGTPVEFNVFDTVLRADLPMEIAPGATVVFEMVFDSQVPLQTRRSGRDSREGIDFSMAQWYPKMAHYDSRGWHADPYIGREFVAPFGSWDVKITMPSEYTIGSTGVLQNPDEIGHGYSDTDVQHAAGSRLTWHFMADDVHDFAWAADPDYMHDRVEVDGIMYHLIYQADVAEGWEFMKRFVPQVIAELSANIGPYAYPQFTVIQGGDGGMEYPMLNLITGGRTANSLIGVTVHEAAHEWFYSMMANNESDYPWFDEGFTSYWTDQVIANLMRPDEEGDIHKGATNGIIRLQRSGGFEALNTPSDYYHTNRAYSTASYGGGQNVARLLGSVIGQDNLARFWKELYNQYVGRHIEPADVERVAEQVSGMELDWFFWQLTQSTREMDYELTGVRNDSGQAMIDLSRNDAMFFPVDLRLTLENGEQMWIHVPTSETFASRPIDSGWMVAEPWPWTYEKWTVTVPVASPVVKAELDPMEITPDYNRENQTSEME